MADDEVKDTSCTERYSLENSGKILRRQESIYKHL